MITPDKFEGAVYSLLFPGGQIPIELKKSLGAIDARIVEIHSLAQGNHPAPKTRRIIEPTESAALTQRIVELRDGQPTPSWRDIAREIGYVLSSDAIRCRYQDAKTLQERNRIVMPAYDLPGKDDRDLLVRANPDPELQGKVELIVEAAAAPALSEAKPELSEKPAIQEEKQPENKETDIKGPGAGKRKMTPSQRGHLIGPKIPHSEDEFIYAEKQLGKTFKQISDALHQKGIECTFVDVSTRYYAEKRKRIQENVAPEAAADPSPPGVEGAPLAEAREASGPTRGTPEEAEEGKPEPRSISRIERDNLIWNLWKEGKTPEEISDQIYAEGLYYDARAVRRILLQQGASL
jgi:hypothetical protein